MCVLFGIQKGQPIYQDINEIVAQIKTNSNISMKHSFWL